MSKYGVISGPYFPVFGIEIFGHFSRSVFARENMKITKKWLKIKLKLNVNSNKRMSKGYIRQYWQRYNPFASGRITQYMHQIACIYKGLICKLLFSR